MDRNVFGPTRKGPDHDYQQPHDVLKEEMRKLMSPDRTYPDEGEEDEGIGPRFVEAGNKDYLERLPGNHSRKTGERTRNRMAKYTGTQRI